MCDIFVYSAARVMWKVCIKPCSLKHINTIIYIWKKNQIFKNNQNQMHQLDTFNWKSSFRYSQPKIINWIFPIRYQNLEPKKLKITFQRHYTFNSTTKLDIISSTQLFNSTTFNWTERPKHNDQQRINHYPHKIATISRSTA